MDSQKFFEKKTGEVIYIIKSHKLVEKVRKWKFNRPPDEERVKDLIKYIKKNKRVDGIICIANLNNELFCYDGQTRLEALKYVSANIDVLTECIEVKSNEELLERFKIVNKCVPVPDIYLENDNEKLIEKTEWILNKLKDTFQGIQSINNNPQRPNYNRDNLCNYLKEFFEGKGKLLTKEELWERIIKYNEKEKLYFNNYKDNKIPHKIVDKCVKTNCYLFGRKKYNEFLKVI